MFFNTDVRYSSEDLMMQAQAYSDAERTGRMMTLATSAFVFTALFIGFLTVELVPGCYQTYPKSAFGLQLYAPEAFVILAIGAVGLLFTYARLYGLMLNTEPRTTAITLVPFCLSLVVIGLFVYSLTCI